MLQELMITHTNTPRCLPLVKSLSSKGLIPKKSTDYYPTVITCLTTRLSLPLCYVLNLVLVFDVLICDGIT